MQLRIEAVNLMASTQPLSVCYLLDDTPLFGGVKVILLQADMLSARGHRVTIVVPDGESQTAVRETLVAQGYGYSLANVRPVNQNSLDGSRLKYVPLSGFNPGLTLGIATLGNVRKTILVEIFSQFCREQISSENIPGMTKL